MFRFSTMLKGAVCALISIQSAAWAQQPADKTASSEVQIETLDATLATTPDALTATTPGVNRWGMTLSSENRTGLKDQRDFGSAAPAISVNSVGATYKFNVSTIELRQSMEYASNIDRLSGRSQQLHNENWALSSTLLRFASEEGGIFGSKPITWEALYYLPTDRTSRLNAENGLLRGDARAEWQLNPNWSSGVWLSPRVLLNSERNPVASRGSDAEYYRLVGGPLVKYSFSDSLSAYYLLVGDARSVNAQRGAWSADAGNLGAHEAGVAWTVGPLTVNPFVVSDVDHANGSGSMFTSDSRVYAWETVTYNLNLYATY